MVISYIKDCLTPPTIRECKPKPQRHSTHLSDNTTIKKITSVGEEGGEMGNLTHCD